ncbi:MAG: redoxin domain-containing protein [Deltaproteobacteria bacterium]|nr:redoxin domain-containing protein [Deltaproteobacteria bacterium]MBI3076968.1 redoxin domain-containing protein [Deltaproteobacteria bacterium]
MAEINVGDVAPDFKLTCAPGKELSLGEFRGQKNVVLAFFPLAFTPG